MTTRTQVDEFLGLHRIAFVGVSRNAADFSRTIWKELRGRGYDLVPVNPAAAEIDGLRSFANIAEIDPPVEGVFIMTPPRTTERVMEECVAAGIRRAWIHRGMGVGSVSPKAVQLAESNGIAVVAGHCPMMFLPKTVFFHRLHGLGKRLTGSYPH